MATTYAYGGEFSSDEDIDRMEQQTEGLPKFGSQAKPTKQQIEEIINTIHQFPVDQDINLSDEHLIAMLDYYKIQRGPVVDSTRKLYKRLILKRIRDDVDQTVSNGSSTTNGNDNNNSINLINKRLQSVAQIEPASSDDDEPMPPVSSQSSVDQANRRKFDSQVAYKNDNPEPMDVDTEAHVTPGGIRVTKQVDISSSEDDDSETSSSGESSDSEELDITPMKNQPKQQVGQVSKIIASTPIRNATAKSQLITPKDDAKKKPYTRSQRVTPKSSNSTAGKSKKPTDIDSTKADDAQPVTSVRPLNKSALTSYENCSKSLSKIKLDTPLRFSVVEDENGDIAFGSTINGRKLNYAEKMVLTSMLKRAQKAKPLTRGRSSC